MKPSAGDSESVHSLLYHSFSNTTTPSFRDLTVEPSLFSDHMAALRESGCRFVHFHELPAIVSGARVPDGPASTPIVSITIDDGLADVETGAAPTLMEFDIATTLFVPTAYVGAGAGWLPGEDGNRPICDWQTLRDFTQAGWEVASHGHRHIAADISAEETVTADALRSRQLLEDRIGMAVTSFAYPFGYYSKQGGAAVRAAGFRQAGIVSGPRDRSGDDRWRLPRAQIGPDVTPEDLVALVHHRRGDTWRRDRVKQRLWLFGRRTFAWGPAEAAPVRTIDDPGAPSHGGVDVA